MGGERGGGGGGGIFNYLSRSDAYELIFLKIGTMTDSSKPYSISSIPFE